MCVCVCGDLRADGGNRELQKRAGCQTDVQTLQEGSMCECVWGAGWSQVTWSTGPWVSMEEEETRQVGERLQVPWCER